MSEYLVEGYGAAARNPDYDGPYLDGHDFDPGIQFAFAGDPEKQAELQKVIAETEGRPVMDNGNVKIITPDGEDNVIVLTKEPDSVKNVVLGKSQVDELAEKTAEAELSSVENPEATGSPSGTETGTDEKVNLNGPSGADESREGADYNPTVNKSPRADDDTVDQRKAEATDSDSGVKLA